MGRRDRPASPARFSTSHAQAAGQAAGGRRSAGRGQAFRTRSANGQHMMVEFVSANPTGPLHVGHGRQAALGDAICNLLASQGWAVTREFYYNDAGVQIANLGRSVQARARQGPAARTEAASGEERLPRRLHAARSRRTTSPRAAIRPTSTRTALRSDGAARRAGHRPAGARRALRQLLPRELALHRRPRGADGGCAGRLGQDLRVRRRAVAAHHRVRRRQGPRDAQVRRHVHVLRAGRRLSRHQVGARLLRRRSTSRAPITTARSRACAPGCRRSAWASPRAIPTTCCTRWCASCAAARR